LMHPVGHDIIEPSMVPHSIPLSACYFRSPFKQ